MLLWNTSLLLLRTVGMLSKIMRLGSITLAVIVARGMTCKIPASACSMTLSSHAGSPVCTLIQLSGYLCCWLNGGAAMPLIQSVFHVKLWGGIAHLSRLCKRGLLLFMFFLYLDVQLSTCFRSCNEARKAEAGRCNFSYAGEMNWSSSNHLQAVLSSFYP